MIKKMKPIFRILALILLINFQLSCSEDNYQDTFNSGNSKSIKKTTINFDEIKNNTKITDKLKAFNDKKRNFKENNRSIYNAEYDFFINTDNIIMAEGDFGTSYTFSIDRNFDYDYIENLVIQIANDNQQATANVIVYTLTEAEKNIVQSGGTISNIVSKTHVYPLDNFIVSSVTGKTFYDPNHDGSPTIYVLADGSCGVVDHIEDLGGGEVMIYFTAVPCYTPGDGGGSADGGSGSGDSVSFDNTSDGNGDPSNYTPGNVTYGSPGGSVGIFTLMNPLTNSMEYQIVKDFRKQLNTAQIAWWTNPNNADAIQSISDYLIQVDADEDFAEELIDFVLNNQTYAENLFNHLNSENWSEESIQFINYVIDVLEENPNAIPLIGADCRSFEFAQPPGATKKGCAVINFNHTFYTVGVFPNGSPYYGEIESNVSIAYFTMPSWMTNGRAANLTAKAVTFAIKATDLYYAANPTVSEVVLGQYFSNRLTYFLNAVGGTVSTSTPPFTIPSPAPYITSLVGLSDPYDCE
jgi:hypothetical protein